MYHSNSQSKMRIFNIFYQIKHISLKALVTQWVHPFTELYRWSVEGRNILRLHERSRVVGCNKHCIEMGDCISHGDMFI